MRSTEGAPLQPAMRPADAERLQALFGELVRGEGHQALRAIAQLACAQYSEQRRLRQLSFEGRVVHVVDGDSIHVESDGQCRRLRLFGLDAPEDGQPGTETATRFVTEKAAAQLVHVRGLTVDKYKRLVAVVTLEDGQVLNHEIVREGWAWHYDFFAHDDLVLRDLEKLARSRRAGIWAEPGAVEPWDWRRNGKALAPR